MNLARLPARDRRTASIAVLRGAGQSDADGVKDRLPPTAWAASRSPRSPATRRPTPSPKAAVEESNKHLNRWEQATKFAIIDRELTVETGDLTPQPEVSSARWSSTTPIDRYSTTRYGG